MIRSFYAYPTYVAPRRTWRAPRGVSSRPLEPSHRALRAQSLRGHNGEVVRIAKKMGDAFASVTSSTLLLRPVILRRAFLTVRTLLWKWSTATPSFRPAPL